jgi:hypothetical protein
VLRLDRAPLCSGIWELAKFAKAAVDHGTRGMQFQNINRFDNGMGIVWIIFVVEWFVFMSLAWYLEQVLDSGIGVRRHWLFPFQRSCCQCALPPLPLPVTAQLVRLAFCIHTYLTVRLRLVCFRLAGLFFCLSL